MEAVEQACIAASAAFQRRPGPERRAAMLDAIASALDAERTRIVELCAEETALTREELMPEFARMSDTLRMFAALVRQGSWVRAAIDTRSPHTIGPNHELREMLVPLGPVAVFGSSNFPLAYGVCGGDTASALAAGCPVIVKEHPAHPRTGRLLAQITHAPAEPAWPGAHSYVQNDDPADYSVARALVQAPDIAAIGFTGSVKGGLTIEKLARERPTPIPVFAEMGSVNPVFITPGALRTCASEIAAEIGASVLARVGQQCTKPGEIFFAEGEGSRIFAATLAEYLSKAQARSLLAPWIREAYVSRAKAMATATGSGDHGQTARPAAWGAALALWDSRPELREEIFGPATLWARMNAWSEFANIQLGGHLTLSVYFDEADPADVERARDVVRVHGASAGRIIFNGVPTGVRVCTSMVHGGPFPATNAPHTTAVGPLAIERWCRPVCYQNCPDALLPPELQDANPRGLLRTVNGVPTRDPVVRA